MQSRCSSSREVVSYSPGPSSVKYRSHPNHLTVGEPRVRIPKSTLAISICLSRFTDAAHRTAWGPRRHLPEPCPAEYALPAQRAGRELAPTGAPGGRCLAATPRSPSASPSAPLLPSLTRNSAARRDSSPRPGRGAPPFAGAARDRAGGEGR